MAINNLESAIQTSVKFYASLTRNQAKGIDSIGNDNNGNPIYVEPGAVCFVSDEQGNSIFVNTKLFGDGEENEIFRDSLGDYLAIGKTDKAILYVGNEVLKSQHAGYTDDEIIVPLIVIDTK